MKTHRVLNRLSKCANARYGKSQVFLWFTINSQSKLLVCNFIKKETLAQMFSCEFCEISKNTFFYRTRLVAASVLNTNSSLRNFMLLVLRTNFLESCMDILTIGLSHKSWFLSELNSWHYFWSSLRLNI